MNNSVLNLADMPALSEEEFTDVCEIAAGANLDDFKDQVLGEANIRMLLDSFGIDKATSLISGMVIGYTMAVRDFSEAGLL